MRVPATLGLVSALALAIAGAGALAETISAGAIPAISIAVPPQHRSGISS